MSNPNKMNSHKIYSLTLIAVVAVGCADRVGQQAAKEQQEVVGDPIRAVTVIKPTIQDVSNTVEINGEIVTTDDAQIGATMSGRISQVYVKEGDSVFQGQVVAMMDSENLRNQAHQANAAVQSAQSNLNQAIRNAQLMPSRSTAAVRQAEASVREVKAKLQKQLNGSRSEEKAQAENSFQAAKANYDTAKKNLERVKNLVKEGALAESQLDAANNQHAAALAQYENALQQVNLVRNSVRDEDISVTREQLRQAEQALESARTTKRLDTQYNEQVQAAKAQLQSAKAQQAFAEKNLREATIRSPFSGRISGKPLQSGVVVGSGTPIARIVGTSGVYFEGQAPSDKISTIKPGTEVSISIDSLDGRESKGSVLAVSPQGDSVGRLFNVRVSFDANSLGAKPGMFARGVIKLAEHAGAIMVPESAIIERDNERYVFLAEGDKAKKQVVTLGLRKGSLVEAVGLSSGAQVINKGQTALVDGMKIKVEAAGAK